MLFLPEDKTRLQFTTFGRFSFLLLLFFKCFFLLKCCCTCRVVNTATICSCRSRLTTMTKERCRLVMRPCTVRLRVSPPVFISRTANNSLMDQLLFWYFSFVFSFFTLQIIIFWMSPHYECVCVF